MNSPFFLFWNKYAEKIFFLLPLFVVLYLFREAVSGGIFYNGDVVYQAFNYFDYYARGGKVISENIIFGFPILGSVMGIWFYPLNDLVISIFGSFHAYVWLDIFCIIAAYVGTYIYIRKHHLSKFAAIMGASVYIFSAQFLLWAETLDNASYYWVLPFALIAVDGLTAERKNQTKIIKSQFFFWTISIFLGLILSTLWLAGHVQYAVYIHSFVFVYCLYRSWPLSAWKAAVLKLGALVLAFVISYVVGYPQIAAIQNLQASSARLHGVQLAEYWAGAYLPQDLIHFILPFFKIPLVPFANPNLYIGLIPLVLLIIAFVSFRQMANVYRERTLFIFYTIIFVSCFLVSFKYSPLGIILHYIPLFDSFREAPRIMYLGQFAAAIVAAISFDFILEWKTVAWQSVDVVTGYLKKFIFWIVVPLTTVASVAGLVFKGQIETWLSNYYFAHHSGNVLSRSQYENLLHGYLHDAFDQVVIYKSAMLICLSILLTSYFLFTHYYQTNSRKFAILLITVFLIDVSLVYGQRFTAVPKNIYEKVPATAQYILGQNASSSPYRVYTILPGQTIFSALSAECSVQLSEEEKAREGFELASELLLPNRNIDFDIDSIAGYDNFMPVRISELLDQVASENTITGGSFVNAKMPIQEKVETIASRIDLLRSFNVRFVISHYPIANKSYTLRFREEVGQCRTPLYIYEIEKVWPRYFLSNNIVTLNGTSTELLNYLSQLENHRGPFISSKELVTTGAKYFSSVTPIYGYDNVKFEPDAPSAGVIFIGNTFLPQYEALVDGQSAKIYRVNHAFMGIEVEKGKHRVELKYRLPERSHLLELLN